jgi:hypothetical protein
MCCVPSRISRVADRRGPGLSPEEIAARIARLEERFRASADELRELRLQGLLASKARAEIAEIRDEWERVNGRWFIVVVGLIVAFLLAAYVFYMNLGWYADQRMMPPSSDWLLDQLPTVNLVPILSWGWLALHVWALGYVLLYEPRRVPFLLFLLGVYLTIRTLYVFLSPIGAPVDILDMRELDMLFSQVAGEYTFQNEFVFSGHAAVPFLFYLFFRDARPRAIALSGSIVMAASVLLTKNHYTVDVLSAYWIGYAIYVFSDRTYHAYVHPLYLNLQVRETTAPAASTS